MKIPVEGAGDGPDAPGRWANECQVHRLGFIGGPVTAMRRIECKVRYRNPRVFIEFEVERADPSALPCARVKFEQPQRARAAGQIMAHYDGEQLLGGAVFA